MSKRFKPPHAQGFAYKRVNSLEMVPDPFPAELLCPALCVRAISIAQRTALGQTMAIWSRKQYPQSHLAPDGTNDSLANLNVGPTLWSDSCSRASPPPWDQAKARLQLSSHPCSAPAPVPLFPLVSSWELTINTAITQKSPLGLCS